ncbi:MAG: acylneuraminate cytidylyltransferase family protein [Actinomycetota bacterium]|jgi:N-acylneuraminate cytidylyltransferase
MSCIAIIPARAGSKGLPGKNTALIEGKSLVQLAIESALSIPEITRVVVTSDDVSVQKIASDLGAEVVVRPAGLAQDNSPIESAILHALAELNLDPTSTDVLTVIQPTSPLRDKQLLATSISNFIKNGSQGSLFGVVEVEHHPAKMLVVNGEFVVPFTKVEDLSAPRQQLDRVVRQSGSIYITNLQQFLSLGTLFINPVGWVAVSGAEAIDIDTAQDLALAQETARELANKLV